MKITTLGIGLAITFAVTTANARGVSPYLPLDLSPSLERMIERVLIIAGKPVMRRPIAAATVLDALPAACERDRVTCEQVRRYIRNYMSDLGITSLQVEAAVVTGDSNALQPNHHGERIDSSWRVSASAFWQVNDYVLLNAGGIAHANENMPTGSFLSLGWEYAQLDIGWRDHWLSPFADSGMLISTEAPTMPSITLGNYEPISRLGINYEIFLAQMSRQDNIAFSGSAMSLKPRLAGVQIGFEPVVGYAVSASRVSQYGVAGRDKSGLTQFREEFFETKNVGPNVQGSNRVAALASNILFPGRLPFGVRIEYAGEDYAYAEGYRLGATSISLGLDLPRLGRNFDAVLEVSEWQNDWYVHAVFTEGLTNRSLAIGHWFGNQRLFNEAIGGNSQMLSVGWQRNADQYFRAIYRTLTFDPRWSRAIPVYPYERGHSLALSLATHWGDVPVELAIVGGRDVFGESYGRFEGSIDLFRRRGAGAGSFIEDEYRGSGGTQWFVDVGANRSETFKILAVGQPNDPARTSEGMHFGAGVRRSASERVDIGVRLELDDIDDDYMLSFRAVDLSYRVIGNLALDGFFGVARYDYGLATNSYFWGAGIQWRDVLPGWDLGFDVRHYEKLNRDKALPGDPEPEPVTHPRVYVDVDSMMFYISRRW